MVNFKFGDWLPQEPWQGPPLPEFLEIFWPWYKEEAPPGAAIGIEIFNLAGLPVESSSPLELTEGESYTLAATITNTSTKAGVPWPVTFVIGLMARIGFPPNILYVVPIEDIESEFAAGETRVFARDFSIPLGWGGASGYALCNARPLGLPAVAEARLDFTIAIVPIEYGATIIIA